MRKEVKPCIAQSVSVFMAEVLGYFILLFWWLFWWCRDDRSGCCLGLQICQSGHSVWSVQSFQISLIVGSPDWCIWCVPKFSWSCDYCCIPYYRGRRSCICWLFVSEFHPKTIQQNSILSRIYEGWTTPVPLNKITALL